MAVVQREGLGFCSTAQHVWNPVEPDSMVIWIAFFIYSGPLAVHAAVTALLLRYPKRRQILWSVACVAAALPAILLLILGVALLPGSGVLSSASEKWLGFLQGFTIPVSGPGGLFLALPIEFNFPYDRDWNYFLRLTGTTLAQWATICFLGRLWLDANERVSWRHVVPLWAVALTFAVFGFRHMVLYIAMHT